MSKSSFKYFSVLPKAIKLESTSSDDEIPDLSANNSIKRFVNPKRFNNVNVENSPEKDDDQFSKSTEVSFNNNTEISCESSIDPNFSRNDRSSHIKLMSRNFSTFSPEKVHDLPDTTIESLQLDSMKLLVKETGDKNSILKNQRDQLLFQLRSIKRENEKKVEDQRNRLEKIAFQTEKVTVSLKSQVKTAENLFKEKLEQRNLNERYITTNETRDHINNTIESFKSCSETIMNLANVLVYDVITENDFETLENTSSLESPVGQCVSDFLAAAKQIIISKQNHSL